MPHAGAFITGFGLQKNSRIAGFTLVTAEATERTVTRYQEYSYHIVLIFRKSGSSGSFESLYHAVVSKVSGAKTIYGVKNPYRCTIDSPKHGDVTQHNNGDIYFELTGHAHRSN